MKYSQLEKYLLSIKDAKFADFSKSLSNSDYISIGVKNPLLRSLIKEHKTDSELKLEDFEIGKYLEIDFIYFGLALSRAKSIEEQFEFLSGNMKNGKSWVLTDCSQTYMKKCDFNTFLKFFKTMIKSKYVYDRRFAYVFAIKFAKFSEIPGVFRLIQKNEDYMVMMAEAWFLATAAIYFSDEVYAYLKSLDDNVLKRKTISKMCESHRIREEDKERVRQLRK